MRAAAMSLLIASLLVSSGCEHKKDRVGRKIDVFEQIALKVNGPLRDLAPYHLKILPRPGEPVLFLDAQIRACVEAEPLVSRLEAIDWPLDEMDKPLSSGKALSEAAVGFRAGMRSCREAKDTGPEAISKCLLRCMNDWTALHLAVEKMREEADWIGVRIEPLAPIIKKR